MTLYFRLLCCATLLFVVSAASAVNNGVPGLEVVAMQGSSTVFRGITDGSGRFQSGPLAPGNYTIEVRIAKGMPPSSARYFLALAGARPLGDAMIRPGVALAIGAQVRTSAGIRGQVSARGVVYVPAPAPAPTSNRATRTANVPAPAANAVALRTATANLPVASARTQPVARTVPGPPPAAISKVPNPRAPVAQPPVGSQPKIINARPTPTPAAGRATIANVSAPAPNATALRTPIPRPGTGPVAPLATSRRPVATNPPVAFVRTQTAARTVPAASPTPPVTVSNPESVLVRRPAGYLPRIINGRRYFWVPSEPGSNFGRWTPESVSRPAITAPSSNNAPATQASPRPSPTPRTRRP